MEIKILYGVSNAILLALHALDKVIVNVILAKMDIITLDLLLHVILHAQKIINQILMEFAKIV